MRPRSGRSAPIPRPARRLPAPASPRDISKRSACRCPPEPTSETSARCSSSSAGFGRARPTSGSTPRSSGAASTSSSAADEPVRGEVDLVVPLVGLRLPVSRLEMAGVEIVRSDLSRFPTRPGAASGAPTVPGSRPTSPAPGSPPSATADAENSAPALLGRVVTTLRLFKTGGVGLGPHAWVRARGDRWRRVTTGAPRPRPGGYALEDSRARGARRPRPRPRDEPRALGRALAGARPLRGRAGAQLRARRAQRPPARTSIPARGRRPGANSHCRGALPPWSPPASARRDRSRGRSALRVERELWSGEPSSEAPARRGAAAIEDLVRRSSDAAAVTRPAARSVGEFGSDLRRPRPTRRCSARGSQAPPQRASR